MNRFVKHLFKETVIQSAWALMAVYLIFFAGHQFLKEIIHPFYADLLSSCAPILILGITIILHQFSNKLSPIFWAMVGNLTIGLYNAWRLYEHLSFHFPKKALYLLPFINNLDYGLITCYLLPLAATSMSFWYVWSHPTALSRFKSGWTKVSDVHGSATFANLKTIKRLNAMEGILIGAIPRVTDFYNPKAVIKSIQKEEGGELIRLKVDHANVIAPSGAGKGVGVIIPTLLEYQGPIFATDIKGENFSVTKRLDFGQIYPKVV